MNIVLCADLILGLDSVYYNVAVLIDRYYNGADDRLLLCLLKLLTRCKGEQNRENFIRKA